MKIKTTGICKALVLTAFCLSVFSCKDTFDYKPENVLDASLAYRDVNDADAAILGLYGKLQTVMGKYIVLNELRGDLIDVTANADKYERQLNEHNVTVDNPWADPRPYYDIIVDCNDIIKNFKSMLDDKRLSQADYNIRYSEVAGVFAWVYLQLGIHYGSVPYVTDALASVDDVKDTSKYPVLTFDQLLDKLIGVMQGVPVLNPIQLLSAQKFTVVVPEGLSLIRSIDGYSTQRMFINRHILFGDLYLWKGNYPMAAHYYRIPLEYGRIVDLTNTDLSFLYYKVSPSNDNYGPFWDNTFITSFDNDYKSEIYTNLPFDRNFKPLNPFIELFSHGGKYQLKPSALSIKNWDDQYRGDGSPVAKTSLRQVPSNSPIDIYRGPNKSYTTGAEPEVKKLLGPYNSSNPFATNGKIVLYRASGLHLHFAEAVNRDGRDRLAYAFLNTGIPDVYSGPPPVPVNVTPIMQSFDTNADYYFDGRGGTFPFFNSPWYRAGGIREHVSLADAKVDSAKFFDMSNPGLWIKPKKAGQETALAVAMEDLILNEDALEMAFEGQRWADLLRIALRREKETPGSGLAFMRAKIAAKFTAAGLPVPDGVAKLGADVKNWYLPFKL